MATRARLLDVVNMSSKAKLYFVVTGLSVTMWGALLCCDWIVCDFVDSLSKKSYTTVLKAGVFGCAAC